MMVVEAGNKKPVSASCSQTLKKKQTNLGHLSGKYGDKSSGNVCNQESLNYYLMSAVPGHVSRCKDRNHDSEMFDLIKVFPSSIKSRLTFSELRKVSKSETIKQMLIFC